MAAANLSLSVCLFTLLLVLECYFASGLTCYSCSYSNTGGPGWDECLEQPWNVTTANMVKCTRTEDVCIVLGVYHKSIKRYQSFTRGCGTYQKTCSEDVHFITCSTRCEADLCNSGKLSIPGFEGGDGDGGGGDGNAATRPWDNTSLVMITWLLISLYTQV